MESKVEWTDSKTSEFPLQIKFHSIDTYHDNVSRMKPQSPGCDNDKHYVLAGKFPAQFQKIK